VTKDLFNSSKLKTCVILSEWIKSVTNALWWAFKECKGKKDKGSIVLTYLYRIQGYKKEPNPRSGFVTLLSCVGDVELLKEMIESIPLHMQNVHQFPNNKKFKVSSHDRNIWYTKINPIIKYRFISSRVCS
jgi:hypothetical protein